MKLVEKIKTGISNHKAILAAPVAAVAPLAMSAIAFAEATPATPSGSDALNSVVITSDMLSPIVDATASNVSVILPVGIILFGIILGITLVIKILKKFAS